MDRPMLSVVIPVYNESETLPALAKRVSRLMDSVADGSETILVDDGSSDGSFELMRSIAASDSRFRAIRLSRNFGHQTAITAGMDFARGDAVVVMDADLQNPPEVVLEMLDRWREGYDVVYGVRAERVGESWFKRKTAGVFYRLFSRLTDVDAPADAGDFRLVDRRVLEAFQGMPERNRYVRGMFSWVGFRQTGVHYLGAERYAGVTKYPLRKMVKFAGDAIVSFSNAPLRIALALGFAVSGFSFVFGVVGIAVKLAGLYSVPGLASIVVMMSFLGGIQLIVLGVAGEYVARIYDEVKARPLYLIRDVLGEQAATGATAQVEARPLLVPARDVGDNRQPAVAGLSRVRYRGA